MWLDNPWPLQRIQKRIKILRDKFYEFYPDSEPDAVMVNVNWCVLQGLMIGLHNAEKNQDADAHNPVTYPHNSYVFSQAFINSYFQNIFFIQEYRKAFPVTLMTLHTSPLPTEHEDKKGRGRGHWCETLNVLLNLVHEWNIRLAGTIIEVESSMLARIDCS